MTDNVQTLNSADYGVVASPEQRNRVLRNTYWLLALSLLPTILGAWVGVATGITRSMGGIINVFVGSSAGMMAISVAVIAIFSAYMLYDLKQIIDGGETNYISATLALYLDIFNVFQALLALLGIFGGERD